MARTDLIVEKASLENTQLIEELPADTSRSPTDRCSSRSSGSV